MASLSFKNISKVYDGGVVAVKDFNLEIKDKEFVVFVGPSGCGKSTTLRMVAGLEEISEGELYIDNDLVNDVEPKDRDIAMVFQNYALYPQMTVKENMSYALRIARRPREEIDQKVLEAARILGIQSLLDRKPKALSGGQRQRVALGRAIVRDPKVFLMDEPLSNLDAKLRVEMRAQISKLHERLQTTFIYVTHDQTEAMTMGDRIVIMKDGIIQQVDTPSQVYFYPVNLFVASFIGSPQMNFLNAKISKNETGYILLTLGQELVISDNLADKISEAGYLDREIILGIRPEHIHEAKGLGNLKLTARVDMVEMMGSEKYVYASQAGVNFQAKFISDTQVDRNQDRDFYLEENKLHFFNKESEENILL